MRSTPDPATTDVDQPVIGVIKLRMAASDTPDILAQSIAVLAEESRDLAGFRGAQILVSIDSSILIVLTEWSDHHAWSQSRYDLRVGKMLEEYHAKATAIEFELYTRRSEFPPHPDPG